MWKLAENSDNIKPLEIDETSSQSIVYVRKDFKEIPILDEEGQEIGSKWQYQENEILKSDWETYKGLLETQSNITDIELAIVELYERGN